MKRIILARQIESTEPMPLNIKNVNLFEFLEVLDWNIIISNDKGHKERAMELYDKYNFKVNIDTWIQDSNYIITYSLFNANKDHIWIHSSTNDDFETLLRIMTITNILK